MPVTPTTFTFDSFNAQVTTWNRWVKRFENAITVFSANAVNKRELLLHYMGASTYNILCDKIMPKEPETLSYAEIVEILENYFNPKPNEILENYRFHLRKQKAEENCSEFLTALKKLSTNCNFGTYIDTAIRNQFVFGLKNQKIQSRLLEKQNLTLVAAINTACAYEAAEKGGIELHQQINTSVEVVNKMHKKNKKQFLTKTTQKDQNTQRERQTQKEQNKKGSFCFRCGNNNHLANECKYKNMFCHFCGKKGHVRKVCFKERNGICQIEEEEETADRTVEELLLITNKNTNTSALRAKIFFNIPIDGNDITFEIDSGAPVTVMSKFDAKKYFPKYKLNSSDLELFSICDIQLRCLGYIWVNVKTTVGEVAARIYIIDLNKKPLLGREWLRGLKLDWPSILDSTANEVVNKIQVRDVPINTFLQKFPKLFSTSMGKITDFQARLYLKPNAVPKAIKARRVPFPLLPAVEREIERQVQEGLLVKVDKSEWATPVVVVQKSDGSVRMCGDYKVTLNPALLVDEHPLPTIDELFSCMAGGIKFSKIDLSKAYLQLEVHPDDQHLLTISTHKGLFQPTRLMFGISCAPAKWQRFIEQLLGDIPGVKVFLDDIKITAPDDETHLQRVDEVLRRLDKHNMRVNLQKSEFLKDKIEYCGYIIDRNGISKVKNKVDAIQNMKKPQSKDEVRSFLGLINYYGRFIENLSTLVYPLNKLLHNDVKFNFDANCERAFKQVKEKMQSDTMLIHYDANLPLLLAVDASPVGVGAVLSHIDKNGVERPIQFASQTLNQTQQKYSQVDKEAYAIIFGVKKFHQYLLGRKFTLITDNKAISQIFSPTKGLPSLSATRMQHYAIFLESFNYDIRVKKSLDNANADALSRLPQGSEYNAIEEIDVIEINAIQNLPVTVEDLRSEILKDDEVKTLVESLKYGRICEPKYRFGIEQTEFALQSGCLLRGIRVFIPKTLRERVLQELHTGHFGMSKMKALARSYCWWYKMDFDIEKMVSNCSLCQVHKPNPKILPVHCWLPPSKVFERVHADFAGPFMGKYFLVLVDALSKWPEVHIVPNMTAEVTIQKCKQIFSTFGIPNILVTDHGTQFNSTEFQNFLKSNGIVHKQGAPYHPSTNGQAERFIQTFKNKMKSMKAQPSTLENELSTFLLAYRRAIHPATKKSPAMSMFGRQIQNRLELLLPCNEVKQVMRKIPTKLFKPGERVAVRDYMSKDKWRFGVVVETKGDLHYKIKLDDSRTWTRHVDQMRKVGDQILKPSESLTTSQYLQLPVDISENPPISNPENFNQSIINQSLSTSIQPQQEESKPSETNSNNSEILLRRSARERKAPERLQYSK